MMLPKISDWPARQSNGRSHAHHEYGVRQPGKYPQCSIEVEAVGARRVVNSTQLKGDDPPPLTISCRPVTLCRTGQSTS